jgi:hypothetical protein
MKRYPSFIESCFRNLPGLAVVLAGTLAFAGDFPRDPAPLEPIVLEIPTFRGNIPRDRFTGIAIDGGTGKICLAGKNAWCEIPRQDDRLLPEEAFIAPTRGFDLACAAGTESGVAVFDRRSKTILDGDDRRFKVEADVEYPSGMTFHAGRVFLADARNKKVFELTLSRGRAAVVRVHAVRQAFTGLASDGRRIYGCDGGFLYRMNDDLEIEYAWPLAFPVEALASAGPGTILAAAAGKARIYLFRLPA